MTFSTNFWPRFCCTEELFSNK